MARKILLADDSVTAQNMGRKILADAGYEVFTVNNGSAALKRVTESKPDLIVLDVYMPGYSGLEVCQRLKDGAETAHIPVLLTVGKLEPFKTDEARRVRADAHIIKPFEASELLTAITRLEDRMVPQGIASSVAGVERFGGERAKKSDGDGDSGWKSRLRFPSKKKKEEPEPEEVAAEVGFREYKKGKGKNAITVKPPAPAGQEPGLVPDIPRDITPDELDALSAAAAKLDASETTAAEKVAIEAVPVTVPVAPVSVIAPPTPVAEFKVEPEVVTPKVVDAVTAPVETVAPSTPAVVEMTPAPVVSATQFVQEPAPVDQADEPGFAASAATATPEVSTAKDDDVKVPEVSVETSATAQVAKDKNKDPEIKIEAAVSVPEVVKADSAQSIEAKTIEMTALATKSEQAKPEVSASDSLEASVPTPPAQLAEVEQPTAPTDEELAEALRLLTPATSGANGSSPADITPSHGTLVAAGQLLAEEVARNAAEAPRWVAESVALSADESALSLESEMFRTFASAPTSSGESAPATGVTAIAAAVENRLTEAGLAATAKSSDESASGYVPDAAATSSKIAENEPTAPVAAAQTNVPAISESEQKHVATMMTETSSAEPAATFAVAATEEVAASASAKDEVPAAVTVGASEVVVEEQNRDTSPEVEGDDSMGSDGKSKGWRQIRTGPIAGAGGAKADVDAAKAAAADSAEEAPKVLAAAAAEGASASSADAGTIASIVDSVMADLRPKIVEEIAKKLAQK